MSSLEREDSNPSRPWGHYIDLLNYMGLKTLPLEVHQRVLRKCVPSASIIRASTARERRTRYHPHAPHTYENRLRIVMKNIRSAGWRAELDDYHFVLDQFAAAGHYIGTRGVLQEMSFVGIRPRAKTYGLCLRALARRLTFPCSEERRPTLIEETTKMTRELIRDMGARKIPFTSSNMDLVVQILRETLDEKGFDELIKLCYGIDLAYPDHLPLEVMERLSTSKAETSEAPDPPLYPLQPLTTHGLNIIVDMLGRMGRISKMVQAFEVLTQPLPRSEQSSRSLFDEDEDDHSANPPSIPEPIYPLPSAKPNTHTFQFLIGHASRADHAVFARHYLVYAQRLDRDENRRLKRDVRTLPVDGITPPLVVVNRAMLLSIFWLCNRGKRTMLMRWTLRTIRHSLRHKREVLVRYTRVRATRYGKGIAPGDDASGVGSESGSVTRAIDASSVDGGAHAATGSSSSGGALREALDSMRPISSPTETSSIPSSAEDSSAGPNSSSASPDSPPTPSTSSSAETSRLQKGSSESICDLVPQSDHPRSAPRPRVFDIDAHISILQRDVKQLARLELAVAAVLGRTIHRVKERLGRRVWAGRTIWLAKSGARVVVTKGIWAKMANFLVPAVTKLLRWRRP